MLSSGLQWLPQGSELPEETGCRFASSQAGRFPAGDPPRAVENDILLARLKPGQVGAGKEKGGGGPGGGAVWGGGAVDIGGGGLKKRAGHDGASGVLWCSAIARGSVCILYGQQDFGRCACLIVDGMVWRLLWKRRTFLKFVTQATSGIWNVMPAAGIIRCLSSDCV